MSLIEDKVCAIIQGRASVGQDKYGTTMERTDLSEKEWVNHAQEEALDLAIYLEKLKKTSNVLSEDDMFSLIALLDVVEEEIPILMKETKYPVIRKKLKDALNLERS